MALILGIDPGSRITGYGIVNWLDGNSEYVDSGCIRVTGDNLAERLQQIYQGVEQLIEAYSPQQMSIEKIFMARNADSALKLGQARAAAMLAGANHGMPVAEYSARQIKQAVVGKGAADKLQVQHMVKFLLKIQTKVQADAADALAIALCHAHTQHSLLRMAGVGSVRRGRLQPEKVSTK